MSVIRRRIGAINQDTEHDIHYDAIAQQNVTRRDSRYCGGRDDGCGRGSVIPFFMIISFHFILTPPLPPMLPQFIAKHL